MITFKPPCRAIILSFSFSGSFREVNWAGGGGGEGEGKGSKNKALGF